MKRYHTIIKFAEGMKCDVCGQRTYGTYLLRSFVPTKLGETEMITKKGCKSCMRKKAAEIQRKERPCYSKALEEELVGDCADKGRW